MIRLPARFYWVTGGAILVIAVASHAALGTGEEIFELFDHKHR